MIITWAMTIAFALLAAALLICGWRLLRGPYSTDRILALDTLYVSTVALAVLLGLYWGSELLFEAALLIALLGFIGTVALARVQAAPQEDKP